MESSQHIDTASSVEEYEIHPLLNDVVLSNLLRFFPTSQLPNFRLVCKSWNQASFSKLQKAQFKICLKSDKEVQEFNTIWNPSDSTISMPFTRFEVKGVKTICPVIEEFFEYFGSMMAEVVFGFNALDKIDCPLLSKILFDKVPQQNLTIIVENSLIDFEMIEGGIKVKLRGCPNPENIRQTTECMERIVTILRELMLPNARKLHISTTRIKQCFMNQEIYSRTFVETFVRDILMTASSVQNLRLEEIEMHLLVHYFENHWMSLKGFDSIFKQLLISQKDALKKLVIFADVGISFFTELGKFHFPKLDTLEIVYYEEDKVQQIYSILKNPDCT